MTPGIPQDGDEEIFEDDEEEVRRLEQERQMEEETSSQSQRQQHLDAIRKATLACQAAMGVLGQDEIPVDDDDNDNPNEWQTQTGKKHRSRNGNANKIVYKRKLYQPMSEAEWLAVGNVWALSLRDRWRLYNCWASLFCEEKSVHIRNLSAQYNSCATRLSELNAEEDYQVPAVENVFVFTLV